MALLFRNKPHEARAAWRYSCAHCAGGADVERIRQLRLLALLEHPDALPADLALSLAARLLAEAEHKSAFRCETLKETQP